jgi:hypothetical protein
MTETKPLEQVMSLIREFDPKNHFMTETKPLEQVLSLIRSFTLVCQTTISMATKDTCSSFIILLPPIKHPFCTTHNHNRLNIG